MQAIKVSCFRIQYPYIEIIHNHGFEQSDVYRHFNPLINSGLTLSEVEWVKK